MAMAGMVCVTFLFLPMSLVYAYIYITITYLVVTNIIIFVRMVMPEVQGL